MELRGRVLFLSSKPIKVVAEKAQLVWHWRHLSWAKWAVTPHGPDCQHLRKGYLGFHSRHRPGLQDMRGKPGAGHTLKDVGIRPKWTLGWPQGQREGPQSCNTGITQIPHHLLWELRPAAAFSKCLPDVAVLTQVHNYFSGVWLLCRLHFVKYRFFFFYSSGVFFVSFPCSCNFFSHCGFLISCSCSSCSICTDHYSLKLCFRLDVIKCYTFPSFLC